SVQYNILKREVESNRQSYDAMLQRVREANIVSAMRSSNIRILDTADVPALASWPDLKLHCALGFVTALFSGTFFILLRERANQRLRQPGESRLWLNVPELGIIPDQGPRNRHIGPVQRLLRLTAGSRSESSGRDLPFARWDDEQSMVADSFRAVLTSILFSGPAGECPRVLVVSSANAGEGKTTITSNLAIALAETRKKVLVIDGDMRSPRMHEIFQVGNDRGLSNLLQEEPYPEDSFSGTVRETTIPGLFVLPSGPAISAPGKILHSANLSCLLKDCRLLFDAVLIDTPPMLQIPDARLIARLSDGVVLVTRADRTSRGDAWAASQRFAEDNTKLIGTILNDWTPTGGRRYYDYVRTHQQFKDSF
ncbi:MAG: polysaccharide biosynthesis tyrosine autokinase, partial [Acidobacteriaceae bacterium]|nr:polysaccharide biosynthesis tyrosine autokinase [Acidobacteriaceae bacterium]